MPFNTSHEEPEEAFHSAPEDDFEQIDNLEEKGGEETGESSEDKAFLVTKEALEEFEIKQVMGFFAKNTYHAASEDLRVKAVLDMCTELIEKDYNVIKISNEKGVLCDQYPAIIPFIESEKSGQEPIYENPHLAEELTEMISNANCGRCRRRFPVPVIMLKGKSVCRSSTLSGTAEIIARKAAGVAVTYILSSASASSSDGNANKPEVNEGVSQDEEVSQEEEDRSGDEDESGDNGNELSIDEKWRIIRELRAADIVLLKRLNVGTIIDLMVENKKTKLGIPVTSSEKIHKSNEYFVNFTLHALPFPGCEFFKEFHENNFNAEGLFFDWTQAMCDAALSVPDGLTTPEHLNINWADYKKWDLAQMTQNYMKYILNYLKDTNSGMLIHCISGWDRTPLFISLIRLSLWADGLIHKSLNCKEILFLTLAYDWMLFGHHLSDRLNKNEDILLFCFTALKYILDDDFSIAPLKPKFKLDSKTGFPFDETDGASALKYEVPPFYPSPMEFQEESNDSMYTGETESPSLMYPASPSSPDDINSVPMETGESSSSNEIDAFNINLIRTSPIEISSGSSSLKTALDSVNASAGSWQMVSATGSVRGSDSQSDVETLSSQGSHGTTASGEQRLSRKAKLINVRRLFYKCYYQTLSDQHVRFGNYNTVLQNLCGTVTELLQSVGQEYLNL